MKKLFAGNRGTSSKGGHRTNRNSLDNDSSVGENDNTIPTQIPILTPTQTLTTNDDTLEQEQKEEDFSSLEFLVNNDTTGIEEEYTKSQDDYKKHATTTFIVPQQQQQQQQQNDDIKLIDNQSVNHTEAVSIRQQQLQKQKQQQLRSEIMDVSMVMMEDRRSDTSSEQSYDNNNDNNNLPGESFASKKISNQNYNVPTTDISTGNRYSSFKSQNKKVPVLVDEFDETENDQVVNNAILVQQEWTSSNFENVAAITTTTREVSFTTAGCAAIIEKAENQMDDWQKVDKLDTKSESSNTNMIRPQNTTPRPLWGRPSSKRLSSLVDDDDDNDTDKVVKTTSSLPSHKQQQHELNDERTMPNSSLMQDDNDITKNAPTATHQRQVESEKQHQNQYPPPWWKPDQQQRTSSQPLQVENKDQTTSPNTENIRNTSVPLWGRPAGSLRSEGTRYKQQQQTPLDETPVRPADETNFTTYNNSIDTSVDSSTYSAPTWGRKGIKKSLETDVYVSPTKSKNIYINPSGVDSATGTSSSSALPKLNLPVVTSVGSSDQSEMTLVTRGSSSLVRTTSSPQRYVQKAYEDDTDGNEPLRGTIPKKRISFKMDADDEKVVFVEAETLYNDMSREYDNQIPLWGKPPASTKVSYNNDSKINNTSSATTSDDNLLKGRAITNTFDFSASNDTREEHSHDVTNQSDLVNRIIESQHSQIVVPAASEDHVDGVFRPNMSSNVAKLPIQMIDEVEYESWSSVETPALGPFKSTGSDSNHTSTSTRFPVVGAAAIPLWGRKSKKNASLEDEPDVRELAFAESSSAAVRVSSNATLLSPVSSRAQVPPVTTTIRSTTESDISQITEIDVSSRCTNISERSSSEKTSSNNDDVDNTTTIPPDNLEGLSEEELINRAIQASKEEHNQSVLQQQERHGRLSHEALEDARENLRTVRKLVNNDDADLTLLNTMLSMCKQDQERVAKDIEVAMVSTLDGDDSMDPSSLETLIDLNGQILEMIEAGEVVLKGQMESKSSPLKRSINLDIEDLVRKKDVFSLICMLRVHDKVKRLDTALALMKFARDAELQGGRENIQLRDEIRSSGGLHSLLTLFRARETLYELKVVAALAIAYVIPSFVESLSPTSASLGLKIVECLRFLVNKPRAVSPNGYSIDIDEMYRASAIALTAFWVNHLERMLNSELTAPVNPIHEISSSYELDPTVSLSLRAPSNQLSGDTAIDVLIQPQQAIARDELLEVTVSLIVQFINLEVTSDDDTTNDNKMAQHPTNYTYTLVEQVCAVEIARPIAVRCGILQILMAWIISKDANKILPAVSALCSLTSVTDKYMAGWIHSEMVNKGAVKWLANLTRDISSTHDVRVAIVQILSSLCTAPHTRAAVIEEDCLSFFVGFLYEGSDPSSTKAALSAAKAILQLTVGAMTRASAFGTEDLEHRDEYNMDRRDTILDDIVRSGVLASIVSIALNGHGQLRFVAILTLRVLSEDISPSRQTRLQLCDESAAQALGATLKDDVDKLSDLLKHELVDIPRSKQAFLKELHEALFALANILEPIQDIIPPKLLRSRSSMTFSEDRLMKGCIDTANSGGFESILKIASIPFFSTSTPSIVWHRNLEIVRKACRLIALIIPLLLSSNEMRTGYSKWSHDLLLGLQYILIQLSKIEPQLKDRNPAVDLFVNVMQGMSALARSEPLRVRIVDMCLSQLVQAKGYTSCSDLSNAASQVFQSLGFAEDGFAAQVAGNSPHVLADWFCLHRSLIIQSMARVEFHSLVREIWAKPLQEASVEAITKVIQEDHYTTSDDYVYLFEHARESATATKKRSGLLYQYREIYESCDIKEVEDGCNLLAHQIYPLSSCHEETRWILTHGEELEKYRQKAVTRTNATIPEHVRRLVSRCVPSKLLQEELFPVNLLRPDASFDCRALMMPQRRYFSFRRQGQLLSRLCNHDIEIPALDDCHLTLGFTNSSFAGEFSESLIQALYLCPVIFGLSFARAIDKAKLPDIEGTSGANEIQSDDKWGGLLVSTLGGSLPPWISHLTFDGIFEDRELISFVSLLECMIQLSDGGVSEAISPNAQTRGKFTFLAIRNSPSIKVASWQSFVNLIGCKGVPVGISASNGRPLSSLRSLDLSHNRLGDDLCATLLEIVNNATSKCSLQFLDLSGNCIRSATNVLRVLRLTVQQNLSAAKEGRAKPLCLHTLWLESNELNQGNSWIELLSLLANNGLGLTSLSIAQNRIKVADSDINDAKILCETLWCNSTLCHLNLSHNSFCHNAIDYIVDSLSGKEYILSTISLSDNEPAMTSRQLLELDSLNTRSRRNNIQKYCYEMNDPTLTSRGLSLHTKPFASTIKNHGFSMITKDISLARNDRPAAVGDNMITVLFSAPLVFNDGRVLRPFAKLDFEMEREVMWQCMKEASRDIELSFDSATHDRLLATITKRCSCLHYSGHGHQEYLPFEDGTGGPYWFKVDQFKSLIAKEGVAPFRFVFVSACFSYLAGETFASAGVPHVVCCQQESELKDTAALAFTRQFYLALSVGHTVRDSFEQGCKAVRATPNLKNPDAEMKKFLLLPVDGNHNVPIFNAKPVDQWPKQQQQQHSTHQLSSLVATDDGGNRGSRRSLRVSGGAKSSELSVRNMMQEDPSPSPPQFFLGREVDMYYVLKAMLTKRLVSIIGEAGIGRSSLACALCHYINERASTILIIDRIYFVRARRSRKKNPFRVVVTQLLKKLYVDGIPDLENGDLETVFDEICKVLKHDKALVVFDRAEILVEADDANEFPMLLSKLSRETKNVRVLLTNIATLRIPSLGEHPISLGPLSFAESVRLFAKNCPYVHTPADRRKVFENLVISPEEGELLATDPGLGGTITKRIFELIGDGVPYKIEKAAYDLTKEDFLKLMTRKVEE